MLYRPFADHLDEVSPEDLARLTDVHEGWYVEYKREMIGNRYLAKSLSSFANQYGGWLFLGVEEDAASNVAARFPGIPDAELQTALDSIRNAAKDLLHPSPYYNVRVFPGPIHEIGLNDGFSIIVVEVPEGPNPPYVHNDGRIYSRVGDSSQPTPVTDRATFDLLAQKGEEAQSRLADKVLWSPVTSKGEGDQPFLHISILSDPYEVMGHRYNGYFSDFAEAMKGHSLPFDNAFSMYDGFIARQQIDNNPYYRLFTWHFSRNCHSFITFPFPVLSPVATNSIWEEYSTGKIFISKVNESDLLSARILDLNLIVDLIGAVVRRHRILVDRSGVQGPFFLKAHVENVWRTVPFVDHSSYSRHISEFGLPIVQHENIVIPEGTSLATFVVVPEISETPTEDIPTSGEGTIRLSLYILNALGIPMEVLAQSTEELQLMGNRRREANMRLRTV